MRQKLINYFKSISPDYAHIEDAAYFADVKGAKALNAFFREVQYLVDDGILEYAGNDNYRYKESQYVEGIFKGYRKSFGFLITPPDQEDVYIAAENQNGAMHNDKVRVRIVPSHRRDSKQEGIVVEILERANETIVGTYDRQKDFGFVIPDDERIGMDVFVEHKNNLNARSGAKVLVKITRWPEGNKKPEGIISEILGYKGDAGLDISCIMAEHKIPFHFPEEVLKAAEKIDQHIYEDADRLDLRQEQIITIDGEDAKDLDDAVSVKELDNGNLLLGVHIADVSHYVKSGGDIDKEAYNRGTSVYLVDRVVPMLPEVLSNGICSLNANEDRYAMTCLMEINEAGKVLNYKIRPSIIRVGRRCSYNEIYKALRQDIIPDDLVPYMGLVHRLERLFKALNGMRKRRGALDFDFPEYRVMLDSQGVPLRIVKRERTIAERIIEECMLIANETVATHLEKTGHASVYRIHEQPVDEKLEAFQTVLRYLGHELSFKGEDVTPREIQAFLETIKGTDVEQVAQIMTLRSMQQAKYSIDNLGHFGLASQCYTHFTSPIRRYPDLMVHRLLKAHMHWKEGYSKRDMADDWIAKAAEHSSVQEQVAVAAERDTDDLKKVQYMAPFVGQVFEAKVNSITSFGMFVELENGIDGLVHINMMNDDYYYYDEDHFILVGRHTGKTFHLGQPVTVTLVKADVDKKQIDFVLGEVDNLVALQQKMEAQQASRGQKSSRPGAFSKAKGASSSSKRHKKEGKRGKGSRHEQEHGHKSKRDHKVFKGRELEESLDSLSKIDGGFAASHSRKHKKKDKAKGKNKKGSTYSSKEQGHTSSKGKGRKWYKSVAKSKGRKKGGPRG
ncbi:MAG: ribonuclease R [Veillonella sp.]|nr:ribonuclease R [Veillonella sp.]